MKIEIPFAPGDKVTLLDSDINARISCVKITKSYVQYTCYWFVNGCLNTASFEEHEIIGHKNKHKIAFKNKNE